MERRAFIAGVAAWSATASSGALAQRGVRRVAILMGYSEDDPIARARAGAVQSGLRALGWIEGRNVQFDIRWPATDPERIAFAAADIAALKPDVIVSSPAQVTMAVTKLTATTPIVFVNVPDPVAMGFVSNLARPDKNLTGFANFELALAGKWLEIIKETVPSATRIGVLYSDENPAWQSRLRVMQTVAPKLGVELIPADAKRETDIEPAFETLVRERVTALVVLPSIFVATYRAPIIALAARHRLPAIYPFRYFAADGGLITYGVDAIDQFKRAASYVDRILKGAKPSDMPVQQPNKYELVINLKTAKALGMKISEGFLLRADEVIE